MTPELWVRRAVVERLLAEGGAIVAGPESLAKRKFSRDLQRLFSRASQDVSTLRVRDELLLRRKMLEDILLRMQLDRPVPVLEGREILRQLDGLLRRGGHSTLLERLDERLRRLRKR